MNSRFYTQVSANNDETPLNRNRLSMVIAIVLLVFSFLGLEIDDTVNSVSTTATQSYCTVVAESGLTVHLVDQSGKPIPNATILLNGTFSCTPAPPDPRLNPSGITDSNGDVYFSVLPGAKYNVTVILPEAAQSRTIIVTQITAPAPTVVTTVDVACTPSAGQCRTTEPTSETQTTTTAATAAPSGLVPGFPPESIVAGLALGAALILLRERSRLCLGLTL